LMDVLSAGNPDLAASAMREHIACGLQHTMEVLEPYFQLRKASGSTFIRSKQKQRQILKSSNPKIHDSLEGFSRSRRSS
jgi:hypothetical protein